MERFRIFMLILICSVSVIQADKLFRDLTVRDQNYVQQWENPQAAMSQVSSNSANAPSTSASQSFTSTPNRQQHEVDERICDLISNKVLEFAHNIGRQLGGAQSQYSKSEIFSPVSVMSALSLLLLGAKGKSYQELKLLFGLDDEELQAQPAKFHEEFGKMLEDLERQQESALYPRRKVNWRTTEAYNNIRTTTQNNRPVGHIVNVANGLFSQAGYSLNINYKNVLKSIYRSDLIQLDFQRSSAAARQVINKWVSDHTFGKIPTIIEGEISKQTNVIIASALYFKGFWENTFFDKATTADNFYPDGPEQQPIQVQMMATGGVFPFYDSVEYDCRIIGLPYYGNLTTMYVIQPHQSTRAKLRAMQEYLDALKIEDLISKMAQRTAVVAFPKMHFVRSFNMKHMLQRLGVNDIFINGVSDLSLIARSSLQNPSQSGSIAASAIPQAPQISQATPIPQSPQIPITFARPFTSSIQSHNDPSFNYDGAGAGPSTLNLQPNYRERFIFSRFGGNETDTTKTGEAGSETSDNNKNTQSGRVKRDDYPPFYEKRRLRENSLQNLEVQRARYDVTKSDLFVDDILHKVDFDVNEQGTEAAAATLAYLKRSGTDVLFRAEAPFLVLIRHDPTKLILFYGIINEPSI